MQRPPILLWQIMVLRCKVCSDSLNEKVMGGEWASCRNSVNNIRNRGEINGIPNCNIGTVGSVRGSGRVGGGESLEFGLSLAGQRIGRSGKRAATGLRKDIIHSPHTNPTEQTPFRNLLLLPRVSLTICSWPGEADLTRADAGSEFGRSSPVATHCSARHLRADRRPPLHADRDHCVGTMTTL